MAILTRHTTVTLPVEGMDCTSCAAHVEESVGRLPGVQSVQVLFAAERATVTFDPARVATADIRAAIQQAGYAVREDGLEEAREAPRHNPGQIIGWGVLGMVAVVILVAALGEWLGLFVAALERLPW